MSVIEDFRTISKHSQGKAAIIDDSKICTYQELDKKSDIVAELILKKIGSKQPILLLLEPSIEQIIVILAVIKARCYYIPCDIRLPEERLAFILSDSEAKLIISCKQHISGKNLDGTIDLLDIKKVIFEHETIMPLLQMTSDEDLAYVIYTSGTTGNPKGVKISHGNLNALFSATREMFSFSANDIWAYLHSYAFDFSVWEMWGALTSGATLTLFPYETAASPELLADELIEKNISILNQTPSAFYRIKDRLLHKIQDQNQIALRYIIFGGEKLEIVNIKSWIAYCAKPSFPILVNMYGITEGTVHCTFNLVNTTYSLYGEKSIIGNPLPGFLLHLLPVNQEEHELLISGPSICQGYLNRPEIEKEKFIEIDNTLFFRTGDLVQRMGDTLEYIGRMDDQVKVRGYRISLGEINHHLGTYSGVQSVITLPISNALETKLVSFVTVSEQDLMHFKQQSKEQIKNWKNIYDRLYRHDFKQQNYTFNTQGWNNSCTNQPFSKEAMQEWLHDTLDKINRLKPKSVLEIGCGSGLILFGLLDKIESYCGIDISEQAISQLRTLIHQKNVSLYASDAIDFDAIPELKNKKFDCIIINSVIQYFPSIAYLRSFIQKLRHFLNTDACIFFGDIRNYDLLNEYHYFVVNHRVNQADLSLEQIKGRVYTSILQEKELLISPDFFIHDAPQLVGIDGITAHLFKKQSTHENELNLFRYDAVLKLTNKKPTKEVIHYASESQQHIITLINQTCFEKTILIISCVDNTLYELSNHLQIKMATETPFLTTIPALTQILRQLNVQYSYMLSSKGSCYFDVMLYQGASPFIEKPIQLHSQIQYANHPLEIEQDMLTYLRKKIPFYAVPNYIHVIDFVPITDNGKINKNRLTEFHTQKCYPESGVEHDYNLVQAENTQVKYILMDIWKRVLKLKTVNLDDDFFEVGGDSISSLQIVHRCKQAGVQLNIRDIFNHRTINHLALMIEKTEVLSAPQSLPIAHFDLSPIQNWFFHCHQGMIHEYCQSFILELQPTIDQKVWVEVLTSIFENRSIFKIRFQKTADQWTQSFQDHHNVAICSENIVISDKEAIIKQIISAKNLFNIEDKHNASVHFFIQETQRFCVISIHHLIIDAISWKNLIDDICALYINTTFYQQNLPNPERTHYAEYVSALKNIPLSLILDDVKFWLPQLGPNFFEPRATHYHDTLQITQSFPLGDTPLRSPDMVAMQIMALYIPLRLLKKQGIVLTFEKHGREDFIYSNIESNLGWHTSIFPIKLDFDDRLDTQQLLNQIKLLLADIPHGGVTFLAAKQHGLLPISQETYTSDISFNFLGNLDNTFQDNCVLKNISPIVESFNQIDLSCPFSLQVNTFIQNKRLVVYFIYDNAIQDIMTDITEKFAAHVEGILSFYQQSYRYPLTNMQNYLQQFSDFPYQFHQIALKIDTNIQRAHLEESLAMLVNHFDIFKMNFKNRAQYRGSATKKLLVTEHFVETAAKSTIDNVMFADLQRPFNSDAEYLVRLNIIHTKQNSQVIILSYHQFVLDGWALQQFLYLWSSYIIDLENNGKLQEIKMPAEDLYLNYLQQLEDARADKNQKPTIQSQRPSQSGCNIIKQRYGTHNNSNFAYGKIIQQLDVKEFATLQSICGTKKITMGALLMTAFGYFLAQNQHMTIRLKVIEAGRLHGRFDRTLGVLTNIRSLFINCDNHFFHSVSDVSNQLIHLQETSGIIETELDNNPDELVLSFQNFKKIDEISNHFANRDILNTVSCERSNTPITIRFVPSERLEIWISYQENNFNKIALEDMCSEFIKFVTISINEFCNE